MKFLTNDINFDLNKLLCFKNSGIEEDKNKIIIKKEDMHYEPFKE